MKKKLLSIVLLFILLTNTFMPIVFANQTDVDEAYIQNLLDMIPNTMNIDIPEIQYEESSNEIQKNIKTILESNNINYTIDSNNNIELKDITYNGRKITIYASGYEIYHSDIRKAWISIGYIKNKTIDLIYNNTNNRNDIDEQYVKSIELESPKYYEVELSFIQNNNMTAWEEFFKYPINYYTQQINDDTIVVKANSGAGDGGLNLLTGEGGTYIALFKDDILYDLRVMGSERSVPVVNVPNTVEDSELKDYVENEINKYKPDGVNKIDIKSMKIGTKDLCELGVDIPDGYSVEYEYKHESDDDNYSDEAAIIIRREETIDPTLYTAEQLLNLIPNEINLSINETEFEQAETLVKNNIVTITSLNVSNITCELKGYRYWMTSDELDIRTMNIKISKDGVTKNKNIGLIYTNSSNWNQEDETYVNGVVESTNFNRTWGFELDHSIERFSFETDTNFSWDKVINDDTISTVYYTEGSGGFLNYYGSGKVCIFKNDVFYKVVDGYTTDIPKVTIPEDMEDINRAYENYAKTKLENYLEEEGINTTATITKNDGVEYSYSADGMHDKIIIGKEDEIKNYFTETNNSETTNQTDVDEIYIQSLLDLIPDTMNIDIPETEYEGSSNEIKKNIKAILESNNIDYTIDSYNNIELKEITYNGNKITIYANGYEIYLGDIRKAYISIGYIKSKTIDLIYNNTNNHNSEDEQYVRNLQLTSPKYYEVDLDFINKDDETSWKDFYCIVSEYYTNQINDSSIVAKADCGAGSNGLNVLSGDGNVGTYLALFKNGILYDIRTMGNERSVPVINVPSNVKDEEINDYVINEINTHKHERLNNVNITNITEGTKDIEALGIDIPNGYTVTTNENDYINKEAIIIRREENTQEFAGGDGTEENPYLISTPKQLFNINNYLEASYKLINDIDLTFDTANENGLFYNDGKGWTSIAANDKTFSGIFDGNNKKIIGLYQNKTKNYNTTREDTSGGLFSNVSGKVMDLTMQNIDLNFISNYSQKYNLRIGGLTSYLSGTLKNIEVSGNIKYKGQEYVCSGGICGYIAEGNIIDCINYCNIISESSRYTGGIAGEMYGRRTNNKF